MFFYRINHILETFFYSIMHNNIYQWSLATSIIYGLFRGKFIDQSIFNGRKTNIWSTNKLLNKLHTAVLVAFSLPKLQYAIHLIIYRCSKH